MFGMILWVVRNNIKPLWYFNTHFMLNGIEISEVDVDLETLGCSTIEQLVVQLLNDGYKLNL